MARIERVELRLVDIPPKVVRTDAIQSFVSQETPIVSITDSDGAVGTGYSYTIGTGGSSIMRLLADHLASRLIGKDAERIEAIWRELEFATHATTIGAISALALAAIDTALWDLRCKRRGLPLWIVAGGAADRRPLYTTEGGWLHIDEQRAGRRRDRRAGTGFHGLEDQDRSAARGRGLPSPCRGARGARPRLRDHDRRQSGLRARRGDPPRGALRRPRPRLDRGAAACRRLRRPCQALPGHHDADRGRRVDVLDPALPRIYGERRVLDRAGRRRAHRRDHALAEGRACRGSLRHAGLPAFSHGAAREPRLRRPKREICRIHSAARRTDDLAPDRSRREWPLAPPRPGIGVEWDLDKVKAKSLAEFTQTIGGPR